MAKSDVSIGPLVTGDEDDFLPASSGLRSGFA